MRMERNKSHCILFRESNVNCDQSHGKERSSREGSEFDPRPQEGP